MADGIGSERDRMTQELIAPSVDRPSRGADAVDVPVDFLRRPIHGPDGRVAAFRRALRLRQKDLAAVLGDCGGKASRETISHWENLYGDGRPRARVSRRNAVALARLSAVHGMSLAAELFMERREPPLEMLARQHAEVASELRKVNDVLRSVQELLQAILREREDPEVSC